MVSGTFKRGMKLTPSGLGKPIAVHSPILFFAQDREIADTAEAGDIIGIPNHGTLRVGDTLSEKNEVRFTGLPNFAPEILRRVVLKDPTKTKQLRKALDDLSEEGVIQVFYPEIGAQWIVGVVGQLQLEVLVSRLEAEYKVEAALEPAPFATARWVKGADAALKSFTDFNRANLAKDRDGDPVFMAKSPWDVGYQSGKEPRAGVLGDQGALERQPQLRAQPAVPGGWPAPAPAMLLGDRAGQRQAQAGAAGAAVARSLAAGERLDHAGDVALGDAGAMSSIRITAPRSFAQHETRPLRHSAARCHRLRSARAPGRADRRDHALRFAQRHRLAHVLVLLDHRRRPARDSSVRSSGRSARPTRASERMSSSVRTMSSMVAAMRSRSVVVLDRFDAHAQRRQRGLEIVADRAEHHVLFVEQRGDARLHRVVRGDQAAHVVGPLGQRAGRRCSRVRGEAFEPAGQRGERPGDPPQQQRETASTRTTIDQQRLTRAAPE